jgi:hypothetical protein
MNYQHIIACSMISLALIAAEPDAESGSSFDLATEIVATLHIRDSVLSGFSSQFAPFLSRVPKDKRNSVQKAITVFAESVADSPELRQRMILLYMKTFSETELRDLVAFNNTPTGKKMAELYYGLSQKATAISQEITDQKQPALDAEVEKILKGDTKNIAITASVVTAESKGTFALKADKGSAFLIEEFDSTQELKIDGIVECPAKPGILRFSAKEIPKDASGRRIFVGIGYDGDEFNDTPEWTFWKIFRLSAQETIDGELTHGFSVNIQFKTNK